MINRYLIDIIFLCHRQNKAISYKKSKQFILVDYQNKLIWLYSTNQSSNLFTIFLFRFQIGPHKAWYLLNICKDLYTTLLFIVFKFKVTNYNNCSRPIFLVNKLCQVTKKKKLLIKKKNLNFFGGLRRFVMNWIESILWW